MKICIATWYKSLNYGTCLQAYGLYHFLEGKGYNCLMLNRCRYFSIYNPFDWIIIIEKIYKHWKLKKLYDKEEKKNNLLRKKYNDEFNKRDELINKFIKNVYKMTNLRKKADYKKLANECDAFITGSDQIWNPSHFSREYLLNFVPDNKKKIAYSSSFGVKKITGYYAKVYKKLLSRFNYIGVREVDGIKIVKDLTGKEAKVVLDPTMLLKKEQWQEIAKKAVISDKTALTKNYILCYFVGNTVNYWDAVEKIRQYLKKDIVIIPYNADSYEKNGILNIETGPNEFLWLIEHCDFLCTDSFHATVFANIFNKNYCVFKRFKDTDKASQNSRLETLLGMFDLKERLISVEDNMESIIKNTINWENVNEILNKKRDESIDFLETAINSKTGL